MASAVGIGLILCQGVTFDKDNSLPNQLRACKDGEEGYAILWHYVWRCKYNTHFNVTKGRGGSILDQNWVMSPNCLGFEDGHPQPKVFLGLSKKKSVDCVQQFPLWKNVHKRKEWPSSELVQVMSKAKLWKKSVNVKLLFRKLCILLVQETVHRR